MHIVNPRYLTSLVLSFLLLAPVVGAQELRVAPPPHVAECLATMTSYGNFIMMRRAGITEDEAVTAFDISLKLTDYILKQQSKGPIPPKAVAMQRGGIYAVYDLPEETMSLNEALSVWMNGNMQKCVEANAPSEPAAPAPSRYEGTRMIPS